MDTVEPTVLGVRDEEERARIIEARSELSGSLGGNGKAVTVLAILAVLYTIYFAASILLPFVLAIVLFMVLSPIMRLLCQRLRFPRTLAALLMIVMLIGVTAGLGAALSVPASGWIAKAPQSMPMLEKKLGFLRQPFDYAQKGLAQMGKLMNPTGDGGGEEKPPAPQPSGGGSSPSMSSLGSIGGSILKGTGAALGKAFTVLLLLFFMLSSGDTMLRRLVEVLPTWEDKKRAVQIAVEVEGKIAGYLATITVMNMLVGLAAGTAMWALGLPDPLLWGTLAFLLNYIPIIGPLFGVCLFFLVGLFSDETIVQALIPAGIYLGIHVLEGETITPMLLAKRLTLNPVLVIASLIFWDWIWGVPGGAAVGSVAGDVQDHLRPLAGSVRRRAHARRGEIATPQDCRGYRFRSGWSGRESTQPQRPTMRFASSILARGSITAAAVLGFATPGQAQILLYAQRLPEGTVYIRLVNALADAATVQTDFAGKVTLGAEGAARISPYYVDQSGGGKTVSLQVTAAGKTATAKIEPKSGSFVTVVLHGGGDAVTAAVIPDKPEFNQLKARLSFYNATGNCGAGSLETAGKPVFSAMAANTGQARSINPVEAKVTASCASGKAPTLDLGKLEAGGLYSVWMMQPAGALTAFVAHDTIAPPQN